jgi:large subunit ribosomal protein L10
MALSKTQKDDVVAEVADLLKSAKMTVVAKYQGTTVKALQQLRRDARDNGTRVKVVKNRLVIKALQQNDSLKDVSTSDLQGMLLYAFNSEDEVAPAQALKEFAKANPTIEFVGAFSADGTYMDAAQVKTLADLPSKETLIGQVVETLLSPVNNVTNALSGNLHALLDGVRDKAAA